MEETPPETFDLLGKDGKRRVIPRTLKIKKLNVLIPLLKPEYKSMIGASELETMSAPLLNFLDEKSKGEFGIIDTENVSECPYHEPAVAMFARHKSGLILDVGAGLRNTYTDNIVNLEVVPYDTTDVMSVGERLPFVDNCFDVVHSNAVLEHVRDPFAVAREMLRVLKPGGELFCCVPFMQWFHAYPHHYFNMTTEGLQNLFLLPSPQSSSLSLPPPPTTPPPPSLLLPSAVGERETVATQPPIHTIAITRYRETRAWYSVRCMLQQYASGLLSSVTRNKFENMSVAALINMSVEEWSKSDFSRDLSEEMDQKLACCNTLFATKGKVETKVIILNAEMASSTEPARKCDVTAALVRWHRAGDMTHLYIPSDRDLGYILGAWEDPHPGTEKNLVIKWQRSTSEAIIDKSKPAYEVQSAEFGNRLMTPIVI